MTSVFCRDVILFTKSWFAHFYLIVLFLKMFFVGKAMTKSFDYNHNDKNLVGFLMNFFNMVSIVFAFIMFNTVDGDL